MNYYKIMPKWTTKYSPPAGSYNYAYYFIHPLRLVEDWFYQVKWFVQRGLRGYSDNDVWGWYFHHANIMVGVLRQLRKTTHGYPASLSPAKWDKKLQVMQEGFQTILDEENDVTSYKRLSRKAHLKLLNVREKKLALALQYFKDYYWNLWD